MTKVTYNIVIFDIIASVMSKRIKTDIGKYKNDYTGEIKWGRIIDDMTDKDNCIYYLPGDVDDYYTMTFNEYDKVVGEIYHHYDECNIDIKTKEKLLITIINVVVYDLICVADKKLLC